MIGEVVDLGPVLISAIEHWSYCPRQCGLIHIEQVFDENLFTMRGRAAHERADQAQGVEEEGRRIERALPLWCDRLGLQGKADVVEFWPDGSILPVEYKHGPRREKIHDDMQLCAQALCLEEMFGVSVNRGAMYYFSSRRRREVEIDDELRAATEVVIAAIRESNRTGVLAPPVDDARCPNCSLIDACAPSVITAIAGRKWKGLFVAGDGLGLE